MSSLKETSPSLLIVVVIVCSLVFSWGYSQSKLYQNKPTQVVSTWVTSTVSSTWTVSTEYKYIEQTVEQMEATLTGAVKYEMLVKKEVSIEEKFDPISMEMKKVAVDDYYGVGAPYWKYRITFADGKVWYFYNQGHIDSPTELLVDEDVLK